MVILVEDCYGVQDILKTAFGQPKIRKRRRRVSGEKLYFYWCYCSMQKTLPQGYHRTVRKIENKSLTLTGWVVPLVSLSGHTKELLQDRLTDTF